MRQIPFRVTFWAYATIYGLKILSGLIVLVATGLLILIVGLPFGVDVAGPIRNLDSTILPYWIVICILLWPIHTLLHQRLLLWWAGPEDDDE
jgi:hypothetical protein